MSRFPGLIYAGDGRSLRRRRPDLTIARLAQYPHRGVVSSSVDAECIRVWCLADNANFEWVPSDIMNQTLEFVLAGAAILLLGTRREVIFEFRNMMLASAAISQMPCMQSVAA